VIICSECGEPIEAKGVHVHPGPGARKALAGVTPENGAKTKKTVSAA
jgi:hypothetical protein